MWKFNFNHGLYWTILKYFLLFTLPSVIPTVKGVPLLDFYPFGFENGDTEIPLNQLESTNEIVTLSPGAPIRGLAYNRVLVSTRGYVKFRTIVGNELKYWKLTVVQNGIGEFSKGKVYYRQTDDPDLLNSTAKDVKKYFTSQNEFSPSWALVVTWLDVQITNQEDNPTVTTKTLVRSDVDICRDNVTNNEELPMPSAETTTTTDSISPTSPSACVNISEATYIQETAVRNYKQRSSVATFQVVLTTDGEYTYYMVSYNGIITCQGTGFPSKDQTTTDFNVSRDIILPGTTNIGEQGKWMYEIGQGCSETYDLVFAIDTSGSVERTSLETTKTVIFYILRQLILGRNKVNAGLISFDDKSSVVSPLSGSISALDAALYDVSVSGGTSNLAEAIQSVRAVLKRENGGRPEVTKVAVIFTDGESAKDPRIQASRAKSEGIAVLVVGVGNGVDINQLRGITSDPVEENLLTVFNYELLSSLQDMIIDKICRVLPNNNPKANVNMNVPVDSKVTLSHNRGAMLGGQVIEVYGPCYNVDSVIRATFGTHRVTCRAINPNIASCSVPMVYFTGETDVTLDVDGKTFVSSYNYENPLQSLPVVSRLDSESWTENTEVSISYDTDLITACCVTIALIGYKENKDYPSMEILHTIARDVPKSETFSFTRPSLQGMGDFRIGMIRISGVENGTEVLWSDVHPLAWALGMTSSDVCSDWLKTERSQTRIIQEKMIQCPCTLQQAQSELGRFRQEPECSNDIDGVKVGFCEMGVVETTCFHSVDESVDGFFQRCCYDEKGSLLDPRHLTGGGTSNRYSPYLRGSMGVSKAGTVPVFSHMYHDVVPFYHCCMNSNITKHCVDFFDLRPPSDCREYGGYRSSAISVIDSDPIVSTLDGNVYTFKDVGEFTVLESVNGDFQIQGRIGRPKANSDHTVLVSLVMINGGSGGDVVQIGLEQRVGQSLFVLRVNGHLEQDSRNGTTVLKGLTVTRETPEKTTVHFQDKGIAVKVLPNEDRLDAIFFVTPSLQGQLRGLLGVFDGVSTNDFTARGGAVMAANTSSLDLHNQFVMSWKISQERDSLFTYPKGRTFYSESINDLSYRPSYIDANSPSLERVSALAKNLCGLSVDCQVQFQEKLDAGISLNTTALGTVRRFRDSLKEVTVCPFLDPSVDLTLRVNVSGYFPGAVAALYCPDGWSVVGYDRLLCRDSGLWDGNATYCEGVLYTDPPAGTMLGGQVIAIRGHHLVFGLGTTPYIRIAGITVRCEYGDRYVAYCRTPTVWQIGVTTVFANAQNGSASGWVYRGEYVCQNMAAFSPGVERQNAAQWLAKGQHEITWSPNDVGGPFVSVELYGYKEDLRTGEMNWQKLATIQQQHAANTGKYVIDSTGLNIPPGFTVGILKVTPTTGSGSALWSDVHPLTWATEMDHKALCRQFTSLDRTLPALDQAGLISCPCNVEKARADDTNFKIDVGCSPNSATNVNCLHNQGAQICFRSIPMSGWEQRCCYDNRGVLLNARDFTGGATPGRYHHDGISPYNRAGSVPNLSHLSGDIMPYLHCCVHSTMFCSDYFDQRRPSDCVSEFPPRPALVEGDPHFITFDEISYTFDGLGEFVIMNAMNRSLQVQGRTEALRGIRGTCFTSFAMKHVDTEVVEIKRSSDLQQVDIFYDRRQLPFNLTEAREYAFRGITIDVESPSKLSVSFTHLSFVMDIELTDEMLNAMLSVPQNFTDNTEGLLGTYNGVPEDDFTTREGYVLRQGISTPSLHTNFGTSWRVTKTESLFTYDLRESYEFYNNQPYNPDYKGMSDLDNRLISGFVKTMCGDSKDCMYDYISKGYLNVASRPQDRRMRDRFWLRLQDLTTSQSCGFLDTIPRGMSRDVSGYNIGDTISLSCLPEYRLVGARQLLCTDKGWAPSEGYCELPSSSTEETTNRLPNPSYSVQEVDSTPTWAVATVVGVVGGVASVGGTILVVRGIMVAQEVARIQAYRLTNPQFGTSGSARPSFKPDLL